MQLRDCPHASPTNTQESGPANLPGREKVLSENPDLLKLTSALVRAVLDTRNEAGIKRALDVASGRNRNALDLGVLVGGATRTINEVVVFATGRVAAKLGVGIAIANVLALV